MPPLLRDSFEEKANSYPDCKGRIKCVLVGDGAVGKTSLIASYTTNGYSTEYTPTAFDNYNVIVNVDNQPILLQLCDTAGQDEFDHLRPLCYPGTDVYIVCFSVVSPTSFANVAARWLREIRLQAPQAPVILVGTQADLREDVEPNPCYYRRNTVTEAEAQRLAESLGVLKYIECSALTQQSLKEVFDEAIFAALKSNAELWRLTAGRSKGNRILASFQQLRGSFSSDRNGPLRTSKRSKCSKEGGSSSSSSSSSIRQPCTTKDDMESKGRQRSWWKRLCCVR